METKLQQEINKVLKVFPKYWQGETLLKNNLIEDIRSYNEKTIEALLSNNLIKDTYALQLPSGSVFKTEDFISMLLFKNYWDNSYTK
ncbi:site-specific DNA-methyltransferase, partial [Mammaliicoccus sciuri]